MRKEYDGRIELVEDHCDDLPVEVAELEFVGLDLRAVGVSQMDAVGSEGRGGTERRRVESGETELVAQLEGGFGDLGDSNGFANELLKAASIAKVRVNELDGRDRTSEDFVGSCRGYQTIVAVATLLMIDILVVVIGDLRLASRES